MIIKDTRRQYLLQIITIMSVYVCNGCGSLENAAVQTMVEAWPHLAPSTIRLMVTLPSFTGMIVMTLIGQFVGKKISFRNCLQIGSLLTVVSGVLPFFIHSNWTFILACRIFLGIGMGMLSIRSSMIILVSKPEDQARFVGYCAVVGSLASAVLAPISGKLAAINWYYPFLVNLVVSIAVVMVFLFAEEPTKVVVQKTESQQTKNVIPRIVIILILFQFLLTMMLYPLLSGLSTYLVSTGLGNAGTAGWLISLYTGAGIFSNLCLYYYHKIYKNYLQFPLPELMNF